MEDLTEYLDKQQVMREAGLLIAEPSAVEPLLPHLVNLGYQQAGTIEELLATMKAQHPVFWHYQGGGFRLLYNFIAQYANGLVEIFDTPPAPTYRSQELSPGFILIIAPAELERLEQEGYDVRSRTGLAFQA
jgi:hypothetical protein